MRALIVDDERLARSELRRLLAAHPEIEIVGEARDAGDAREHIERLRPDLLFLDIQMPGCTGFELLEKLEILPLVVFTTAYDEHALKAFEVNALDYLLKPIVPERLAAAVSRAIQDSKAPAPPISADQKIFVRDGERCWFVPLRAISLFESEGNYTRVYFDTNRPLVLRSLNALESRLDRSLFYRSSRRHIVNLQSITAITHSISGGLILTLEGKHTVEMSRRRTAQFRELMSL